MSIRDFDIREPKIKYPKWLQQILDEHGGTGIRSSPDVPLKKVAINPDSTRITVEPTIAYSEISSPGEPVFWPDPVYSVPKYPIRIRAMTNDNKPINFEISVNIPDVLGGVKEKRVYKTENGEKTVMAYQGHTFEWVSPRMGWIGSGVERKRVESLVPLSGDFKVNGPSELVVLPESGFTVLNGILQEHSTPYR